MSRSETYLGGVKGAGLSKKGIGVAGYEIHATSERIFGVRALRYLPEVYGSSPTGGFVPIHEVAPTSVQSSFIQELERKKDFVVRKEEVRELVIARPKWPRNGYLLITKNPGDQIKIRISGHNVCSLVVGLMTKFYPQAVKLE